MPINIFNTFDDPSAFTGTTQAWGVNDTDQIVGSYQDASGAYHGFLESGGIYTVLNHPLGNGGTFAQGINDAGQIVGSYTNNTTGGHGFLLSAGTFTTLDDPSATFGTFANSINASGQIVGSYADASNHAHGFLLSGGTYFTLDDPTATLGTFASSINAIGQIVGYYQNASGYHGFLYDPTRGIFPPTSPSTIPWPPTVPRHMASMIWVRSSGRTTMLPAPTVSSSAAACSPPSTIP